MTTKAKELWDFYGSDAEWEACDHVDDYTWDCSIYLEVDGYIFEGAGYICCGEKEIEYIECTTPEGEKISIC